MHAWVMLLKYHFTFSERDFLRSDYVEWDKLGQACMQAMREAFQSVVDEVDNPVYNVRFFYFHILRDHFVSQILWLGPPSYQNTQLFEREHQVVKSYTDTASMKEIHLSIMNQVHSSFFPWCCNTN